MVVIFAESSENKKIAGSGQVAATYVATNVSCPTSCALRNDGCYAEIGNVGFHVRKLNAKVPKGMRPEGAARQERTAILGAYKGGPIPQDGAKGGRDLRMHVSGDARTRRAVRSLAEAGADWRARGGGSVWTYTHAWKTVPRKDWGTVSVLASMEDPRLAEAARAKGYAPALVVAEHLSDKAYTVPGSDIKWIPCPEQSRGIACSDCRLCMNADRLRDTNRGIAFAAHGATKKIRKHLTVVS
jgi:hypothetical protein